MRNLMLSAVVMGASLTIASLTAARFESQVGMSSMSSPTVHAELLPQALEPERAYLMRDTADGSWAKEKSSVRGERWSRAKSDAWNSVPMGDKWITTLGCEPADGTTCTEPDLAYLKSRVIIEARSGPLSSACTAAHPG